jgi:hypothetical protein
MALRIECIIEHGHRALPNTLRHAGATTSGLQSACQCPLAGKTGMLDAIDAEKLPSTNS